MGEIVNLRRARKAKRRAAEEQRAAERRAKFMTPKSQRDLEKARTEKRLHDLAGHKQDDD